MKKQLIFMTGIALFILSAGQFAQEAVFCTMILTAYKPEELKEIMKQAIVEANKGNSFKPGETDEYLSQQEARKFLRISNATMIRWKNQGKLPYYQEGRKVLFKKSELLKVMQKNHDLIK